MHENVSVTKLKIVSFRSLEWVTLSVNWNFTPENHLRFVHAQPNQLDLNSAIHLCRLSIIIDPWPVTNYLTVQ